MSLSLSGQTAGAPIFRMTFLDRHSTIFQRATEILADAATANQLVGQGACWLPTGLSPAW
jgi:hypothetical protein